MIKTISGLQNGLIKIIKTVFEITGVCNDYIKSKKDFSDFFGFITYEIKNICVTTNYDGNNRRSEIIEKSTINNVDSRGGKAAEDMRKVFSYLSP